LEKIPKAAKVLEINRKKLLGRHRRTQKEYGLGLPYARPALVTMADDEDKTEIYA
jgi:hypothetical protein